MKRTTWAAMATAMVVATPTQADNIGEACLRTKRAALEIEHRQKLLHEGLEVTDVGEVTKEMFDAIRALHSAISTSTNPGGKAMRALLEGEKPIGEALDALGGRWNRDQLPAQVGETMDDLDRVFSASGIAKWRIRERECARAQQNGSGGTPTN